MSKAPRRETQSSLFSSRSLPRGSGSAGTVQRLMHFVGVFAFAAWLAAVAGWLIGA